jgi:uncharacterized membrane protein YczE
MFKQMRWKTFPRDFLQIQLGFLLFGLSIAVMIRASLGTSAWAVLEVALAQLLHLTPGTLSIIVGFVVLGVAVALREKIGWGTLANILFIGPWEDLFLYLIPTIDDNLWIQIPMLLGAIAMMGLASAIYIGVDAGAGPRDSLMLAIKRKTGWSIRAARGAIEITVVILGWALGGPAGIGTVVFALLIGTFVQWGFKLLKVEPHREVDSEVEDG